MITEFDSVSANMARLALSLYAQEQLYISNNIANVNTPGYLPQGLDFEKVYAELTRSENAGTENKIAAIKNLKNEMHDDRYLREKHDKNVDLDKELLKMTENTVKYKVMLSALKSKGEFMKLVLRSK